MRFFQIFLLYQNWPEKRIFSGKMHEEGHKSAKDSAKSINIRIVLGRMFVFLSFEGCIILCILCAFYTFSAKDGLMKK